MTYRQIAISILHCMLLFNSIYHIWIISLFLPLIHSFRTSLHAFSDDVTPRQPSLTARCPSSIVPSRLVVYAFASLETTPVESHAPPLHATMQSPICKYALAWHGMLSLWSRPSNCSLLTNHYIILYISSLHGITNFLEQPSSHSSVLTHISLDLLFFVRRKMFFFLATILIVIKKINNNF